MSRVISRSRGTKYYIKCVHHRLKRFVPKYGRLHRSLEFAFDPGDFACDPSKIVPRVFESGFYGSVDSRRAEEAELDGG